MKFIRLQLHVKLSDNMIKQNNYYFLTNKALPP